MGSGGLVGECPLGVWALLPPEWRVGQNHLEVARCTLEQLIVDGIASERVAVPNVRKIDPVENKVGKADGIGQIVLFASVERLLGEYLHIRGQQARGRVPHVLVCLREKATRSAAGIVDSVADLRLDHPCHGPHQLPRRVELPSIVVLLPHLEQEPLVGPGEREDVLIINAPQPDVVDSINDVQEVAFRVHAGLLHVLHDLADQPVTCRGPSLCANPLQMRQQVLFEELEDIAGGSVLQLPSLRPATGCPAAPLVAPRQRSSIADA